MVNYKITIVKNHPEYVGKKLLLTTKLKDRLFYNVKEDCYIEIKINNNGELRVNKVSKNLKRETIDYSLRKVGEEFLGFTDPSVDKMLNYLIIPEMEVERIFNNLRYKYLNSIYLSDFENPQELICADYNRAFQALADIYVDQGPTKNRKENDYFWKCKGFKEIARITVNFNIEKNDLKFIITFIRTLKLENFNHQYAELIAIKPGFHELWIHPDYFEDKYTKPPKNPDKESKREKIFRFLRRIGHLSDLVIEKLPWNTYNWHKYFSYAPCAITEGPFVFRKKISTSYITEIRKITSKKDLHKLEKWFDILDYRHTNLDSREKLRLFLENTNTKRFLSYK